MKKTIILIISILLLYSCSTQKEIIIKNDSKNELETLLMNRYSDEKIRHEIYNDIVDAFYNNDLTMINNNVLNDSILMVNKK